MFRLPLALSAAALQTAGQFHVFRFTQTFLNCSMSHSRNVFRSLPDDVRVLCSLAGSQTRTRKTWTTDESGCTEIGKWLVSTRCEEMKVRDALCEQWSGTPEVQCPSGSIDVLTDTHVIECKHHNSWKAGVGQVLVYQQDYEKHKPMLYVFGNPSARRLDFIIERCARLGVSVVCHDATTGGQRKRKRESSKEEDAIPKAGSKQVDD